MFDSGERDSISFYLINVFRLPSRVFEIPVPAGDSFAVIRVCLRLLSDQEIEEVAKTAEQGGMLSQQVLLRRETLARSIVWVENQSLEMPSKVREAFVASFGREPTELDQKRWVLSQCQPRLLEILDEKYNELVQEQEDLAAEVKKKFIEQRESTQDQQKSWEQFTADLEASLQEDQQQS